MPMIVDADGGADLGEYVRAQRSRLERDLERVGAILFRGFRVSTPDALANVVAAAAGETMRYLGGDSPRLRLGGDVYTASECPASVAIPLHNEMSYLDSYPGHLWFACQTEARVGGETTLADGRAVLRDLDPAVRDRFIAHGVHYVHALRGPSYVLDLLDRVTKVSRTWMEAFETDDRGVADERAARVASRHYWLPSERMVIEHQRPATVTHPSTGELAWFNQAHLFRLHARGVGRVNLFLARLLSAWSQARDRDATFGDGTEIDGATLHHVFDVLDRHTVPIRWNRGQVLWIDNRICMHGRRPFRGPRRVLVTMTR